MTPTTKTVEVICNDAPEDFMENLIAEVRTLTETECAEVLAFVKETFMKYSY